MPRKSTHSHKPTNHQLRTHFSITKFLSSFFFSIQQFQAIELKFIQNCTNFNESLLAQTSIEETRNERERKVIKFG